MEIRFRIFYLSISCIITILMSYSHQIELIHLFGRPLYELYTKFIFLELTEAFYTILEICIMMTLVVMTPIIIYQLWSFFIPSSYFFQRKRTNRLILCFCFLFLLEICCIYSYIFPKLCMFLISFEMTGVTSTIIEKSKSVISIELTARIQSYVKFLSRLFLFLLSVLQIPFIFYILYRKDLITCYELCRVRKFLFFSSILVSAFISPPDIISQSMCTCIFVFLYEAIIYLGFVIKTPN